MNYAPQPAGRGADEALLEIPAYKLEKEVSPVYQITKEMRSRN